MQLADKVAIVTGGGKGIGRAISLAFAQGGADVVVAARTESALRDVASEIEAMGRKSLAIVTDLTVPEQTLAMVERTMDKFGKVDILVNNSGLEGPMVNVADMDIEGWNQTLALNLTGAMLSAMHVLKQSMIPRKSGVIINISSVSGRRGPAMRSSYSSTKWGIIGFTQSLASEVGRYGIRVNCIAPGLVEGERIDRVLEGMGKSLGMSYEHAVKTINARTALGRMLKPEEVAALAVFLASEQSSGITGQTINCDAGLEMD